MNQENLKLASQIIQKSYVDLASEALQSNQQKITNLLAQRRYTIILRIPDEAWSDIQIESFLNQIAQMDTNNFDNKIGVGERESRIFSKIVEKRHFYMGHGIGRSGDVSAQQPKAAGASLILKLTQYLTKDALQIMGYQFASDLLVLPLATGMSLVLCLLTLKQQNPNGKYVIWPRIDQKTCFKSIQSANLIPIVIDNILEGDEILTNTKEIENQIQILGSENVLCVLSTTSCFAARGMDRIEEIGLICQKNNIFHLLNNAYGLQCSKIANSINLTMKQSRLDLIVQSTDKNFMVPVGGSIVFSKNEQLIQNVSQQYPGRASASPIQDLFITLLGMGKNQLKFLLKQRKELFQYAQQKLQEFSDKNSFILLKTPNNKISIGIYLKSFKGLKPEAMTLFGSILYKIRIMGCRIVAPSPEKKMGDMMLNNYGSHINDYPFLPYMTVAIAIGMCKEEIDIFINKLEQALKQFNKKLKI